MTAIKERFNELAESYLEDLGLLYSNVTDPYEYKGVTVKVDITESFRDSFTYDDDVVEEFMEGVFTAKLVFPESTNLETDIINPFLDNLGDDNEYIKNYELLLNAPNSVEIHNVEYEFRVDFRGYFGNDFAVYSKYLTDLESLEQIGDETATEIEQIGRIEIEQLIDTLWVLNEISVSDIGGEENLSRWEDFCHWFGEGEMVGDNNFFKMEKSSILKEFKEKTYWE